MENVYAPKLFSATEPLDFEEYFNEYAAAANIITFSSEDVLQTRMKILHEEFKLPLNMDEVKELEALCTIDKLKVYKENTKLPLENIPRDNNCINETHPIIQEARTLCTVQSKEEFNAIKDDLLFDLGALEIWSNDTKVDANYVEDIQPGSNFIHKVLIFVPFNTLLGNRLTPDSVRVQYELEVLGTNTLLDLANAIECVSDSFITREVPDMQVDFTNFLNPKEVYPSRSFFIENVFYNDLSHPNAIDYSEVVKKWAVEKKIGVFKSESMSEVTFDSLKSRLGYGYVYIHQGNCEHVINFSDARLVQNSDCLVSKKYPRKVTHKRHTNYLCFICSENHSSWLVINSDRLPVRKAFFCTKCCESYMFLDGKKIGEFQLYPYYTGAIAANQQEKVNHDENYWGYIDDNEEEWNENTG